MGLLRALDSSIGRKLVIAVTGLLLCVFLVTHLAGNLLMYVPADPEHGRARGWAYNAYAHNLHSMEPLVVAAEIGLLVLFGAHLYLAFRTTLENTRARRHAYSNRESKLETAYPARPDTWMIWSGLVILGFLIWHLVDFTFEARGALPEPLAVDAYEVEVDGETAERSPFDKAVLLLKDPVTAVVYVVGCIALLFHLLHGFRSSFQTLGLNHPAWNRVWVWLGVAFSLIVGIGFASFVVWARFEPPPPPVSANQSVDAAPVHSDE